MIAPTSEERIQTIAGEAHGFIYVVSSMGVTGVRSEIKTDLGSIVESIRKVTDTPCAIGFGISTPEQAAAMAAVSDGAIVGSAIVKLIEKYGAQAGPELYNYVKSMKDAVAEV
jgi:tryptophan synthase alpha chain